MTRTMCVSFACYSYQDVIYAPHRDIDCYMSLDRIVSTLRPVCWPSPNTLRITVNEGQSWAIPSHSESTAYVSLQLTGSFAHESALINLLMDSASDVRRMRRPISSSPPRRQSPHLLTNHRHVGILFRRSNASSDQRSAR